MKLLLVLTLLMPLASQGKQLTVLKNVDIIGHNSVTLNFDKDLSKSQMVVDYFRDIIQISIKNASVYPAKILRSEGKKLKKVFAYQYTPDLVRCRITVDGEAEKYRGKVKVSQKGKKLRVVFGSSAKAVVKQSDRIVTSLAKAKENSKKAITEKKKKSETQSFTKLKTEKKSNENPFSPLKAFVWLAVVVGIVGVGFFVVRKILKRGGGRKVMKLLSKTPFANTGDVIKILANHYLGPNRSIALVEIRGQTLVIGITEKNINLISRLEDIDETQSGPALFSSVLQKESNAPTSHSSSDSMSFASPSRSKAIRDQIRRRVEGLKSL